MTDDWLMLCEATDMAADKPHIDVRFADDRRHRVTVKEDEEGYVLMGFVVRQAVASSFPDLAVQAWLRNRSTLLVGFRIDQKGRLVGEAWVPKIGLTATEFQRYVRSVAIECDRFEFVLTGRDVE